MASIFQKCKTDQQCKDFPCEKTRCGHLWTVSYREPGGRQGRKRERSFRLKREAESFATKVESEKNQGVYVDPDRGKIPVRVWAQE
ncbi:Arm DNA-binding domain-containing protein, partial [Streptomyces sp. NPDC056728]